MASVAPSFFAKSMQKDAVFFRSLGDLPCIPYEIEQSSHAQIFDLSGCTGLSVDGWWQLHTVSHLVVLNISGYFINEWHGVEKEEARVFFCLGIEGEKAIAFVGNRILTWVPRLIKYDFGVVVSLGSEAGTR